MSDEIKTERWMQQAARRLMRREDIKYTVALRQVKASAAISREEAIQKLKESNEP